VSTAFQERTDGLEGKKDRFQKRERFALRALRLRSGLAALRRKKDRFQKKAAGSINIKERGFGRICFSV